MTIPSLPENATANDVATYSIQDAARLTGVTPHTLRWYERVGLVPGVERSSAGRRRFTANNLRWVVLLRTLRATGMPVAQLQELTKHRQRGSAEPVRGMIRGHRTQVLVLLSRVQQSLAVLDEIDNELRREMRELKSAS